jgi:hypothetical protein
MEAPQRAAFGHTSLIWIGKRVQEDSRFSDLLEGALAVLGTVSHLILTRKV